MPFELDELEKSRVRRALQFVNAQRKLTVLRPIVVTGKYLLWFFLKVLFWSAVVAACVIGWLAL